MPSEQNPIRAYKDMCITHMEMRFYELMCVLFVLTLIYRDQKFVSNLKGFVDKFILH